MMSKPIWLFILHILNPLIENLASASAFHCLDHSCNDSKSYMT